MTSTEHNKEGSIEETIDNNNYRRGKMHSSDQNIKTVEEMLFDAISSFDCKKVRSLVEQAKQEGNNVAPIMNEALNKANTTKVKQQSTASRKKLKKIKDFLKKELDNIAILSMNNDVETTASSQEVPIVERKESEPDSLSLSSEEEGFSKLESDDSAGISSDSPSFDMIDETEVPETASAMPSMVTEKKSDDLNDEKDDQQNLIVPTVSSSVSENIGSNSASEAELLDDDEDDRDYYYDFDPDVDNDQKQDIQSEALASEFEIENVNNDFNVNQPTGHVEQVANGNG
ncbi:MAG: hypothetical protein ACR5LA_03560 [Wolbachia sp.]